MSSSESSKAAMVEHSTNVTKEHILELFEICRQFDSETVNVWEANFVEEYEGKNHIQRQLFCIKTQMELMNTFGDLLKDKKSTFVKLLHDSSAKMSSNNDLKTILEQLSQSTGMQFGTNLSNASNMSIEDFANAMEEDFKTNGDKYEALIRQFQQMTGMNQLTQQFMDQCEMQDELVEQDDDDEHPPDNVMDDDES